MKRSLSCLLLLSLSMLAWAAAPLPPDSVLQLPNTFTDQAGKNFQLPSRRGQPQLVAMFYTSCDFVCPLIIDTGLGIDHALTPDERSRLRVLLVSLDSDRDNPAVLQAMMKKRKLDSSRWTLARTDKDGVAKFAALLNVRYRKLANGDFNHSSALTLLDAEGRVLARSEKLGAQPDPAFLAAVKKTLAK